VLVELFLCMAALRRYSLTSVRRTGTAGYSQFDNQAPPHDRLQAGIVAVPLRKAARTILRCRRTRKSRLGRRAKCGMIAVFASMSDSRFAHLLPSNDHLDRRVVFGLIYNKAATFAGIRP
jgi:hypothetical protein